MVTHSEVEESASEAELHVHTGRPGAAAQWPPFRGLESSGSGQWPVAIAAGRWREMAGEMIVHRERLTSARRSDCSQAGRAVPAASHRLGPGDMKPNG